MNDIFCDHISRSCFRTEDHCDRSCRFLAFFDLEIFIDHIECIHLLTFVLMQSLDLNIENRIFIDIDVLCLL